jgi:hypothetical protein
MAFRFKNRAPESVFTPRGDLVTEMYVSRPALEEGLINALKQPKSIVLHGESGSGKTWLYKKVFQSKDVYYEVANLGRSTAMGSISKLLETLLARISPARQKGYTESKSAEVGAGFAKGALDHTKNYELGEIDSFELVLKEIRKKAGRKSAVLVFENLEQILHAQSLLDELSSLLLLVDDSNYAVYKVKILLVTTASNARTYLASSIKSNTITNRITEIPEVARLLVPQAEAFVKKGFFDLLGMELSTADSEISEKKLLHWILWYSDRIPQYLHELCLEIAHLAEKSGRSITNDHLLKGTAAFVRGSLISEISTVEANLNSKSTQLGRRNQVIYALGQCKEQDFDHIKIERIVRSEFPLTCSGKGLNVSQILSQLASSNQPLIRRVPHGSAYRFIDPKLRIVVRLKVDRAQLSEVLVLRDFDDVIQL